MRTEADLKDIIRAQYGEEPDGPAYTEQDLHEQIRKLVDHYHHEHPEPDLDDNPTLWARTNSPAPAPMKHRGGQNIQIVI
jgi:hypothetical protein